MTPESLIFLSVPDRSAAEASPVDSGISRPSTSAVVRFMSFPSWLRPVARSRERGDVRQVAVALVPVEAVADDEEVGDGEADVVEREVGRALTRLGEQRAHPERGGVTRLEVAQQIRQSEAARADALDHEDVPALDGLIEVLADARDAGGAALGVRHRRDEVEGSGNGELAHEVGDEQRRPLENGDQVQAL